MVRRSAQISETQKKRSLKQRMLITQAVLGIVLLIIIARLIELQIVRSQEFFDQAQAQHFGDIRLSVRRGEILSRNSKTGELSILATNTTLDMVYVDPVELDDPTLIAETLSDILITEDIYKVCTEGLPDCPSELYDYFKSAFDPLERMSLYSTGALLEPLPANADTILSDSLPDITEVRRLFARSIETRISEKRVTYMPLVYGATKKQMQDITDLSVSGLFVSQNQQLIYANPEEINQTLLPMTARRLRDIVDIDTEALQRILRSRPLRYVPIMRELSPAVSEEITAILQKSQEETVKKRRNAATNQEAQSIRDPFRSVVLKGEHWRFYPDANVASNVVGFLNDVGDPQYGIERTFNPQLRGQEGLIRSVSDREGAQIVTAAQTYEDAKDGDSFVLTIDRFVQKEVERIMTVALKKFEAESGQAIIMDPFTGRIIAMVNVPTFDSNHYGQVYKKEPIYISDAQKKDIVVELYHPQTHEFILRALHDQLFTEEGRLTMSEEKRLQVSEVEDLYTLRDVVRYYLLIGEHYRWEIFPTDIPNVWLKFKNNIGVGAYLNRTIQEIYEPGSVLKAISMAIALDQGEVTPTDIYHDDGPIDVDEYTIHNSLNAYYGDVTMTNCLEFSINTCMTEVSGRLGRKLYHRMLTRFGFGNITGIELEDELAGELRPWRKWSNSELATYGFGQGISSTPLQVVTAFAALANGGKLMRPMIIDSVIHPDGTVEKKVPHVVDLVIKPETSEVITSMLVSTVTNGYARTAKVPGHRIAGKTGTSQIAGPGGRYETGTGSTRTTFAGYAPVDKPRFVMLIKFDRPKAKKIQYGSQTAAPVFKEIAEFLFKYYGIPPDEDF